MSENPYQSPEAVPEREYTGPRFRLRMIPCVVLLFFGLPTTIIGLIGVVGTTLESGTGAGLVLVLAWFLPGVCLLGAAAAVWWKRWRLGVVALLAIPLLWLSAYLLFEVLLARGP